MWVICTSMNNSIGRGINSESILSIHSKVYSLTCHRGGGTAGMPAAGHWITTNVWQYINWANCINKCHRSQQSKSESENYDHNFSSFLFHGLPPHSWRFVIGEQAAHRLADRADSAFGAVGLYPQVGPPCGPPNRPARSGAVPLPVAACPPAVRCVSLVLNILLRSLSPSLMQAIPWPPFKMTTA